MKIKKGMKQLSEKYFLPSNYSRILSPNSENQDSPIMVDIEINDLDIIAVNDHDFTITSKMFIGVHWKDPRILYLGSNKKHHKTYLDLELLEYLWTPDLDIYSLDQLKIFEVMGKDLAGKKIKQLNMFLYLREPFLFGDMVIS